MVILSFSASKSGEIRLLAGESLWVGLAVVLSCVCCLGSPSTNKTAAKYIVFIIPKLEAARSQQVATSVVLRAHLVSSEVEVSYSGAHSTREVPPNGTTSGSEEMNVGRTWNIMVVHSR